MTEGHAEAVEHAFSTQAAAFEDHRLNRVFTSDAEWIFERLTLDPDHVVLDVAAGTGHAARLLAPSVRAVVALDATAAMLETGKAAAEAIGLRNLVFLRGDAAELPFADSSFDVVVCRFAVHHFEDPQRQLREMARCLRPGGQLVVADLVANDDAGVARTQHQLEQLRDPSHVRLLAVGELRDALADVGVFSPDVASREIRRPLAPWLTQAAASDEAVEHITRVLRSEIEHGSPTGFDARDQDGEIWFSQRFASITARKPA